MPNFDILLRDLKVALRSLAHTKGLAITVILTLALGIGANAAIFSVVRGVLLRPLVNRDENSLIYIRQSAPGIGVENTTFSVPEIQDMQSRVKTISEFGDFSTIGFSVVGLGEPRQIRGGVVDGSYFDVMGLHPVLGRLLDARDDGNNAAGAVVLTYRFWTTALHSDPSVIGKTIKLDTGDPGGARSATIVGVLEPSVPYPAETEIIANVVTSPHHLSATMVTGRVHRMTELFGRLAPGATLEQARAELNTAYGSMVSQHSDAYPRGENFHREALSSSPAQRSRRTRQSGRFLVSNSKTLRPGSPTMSLGCASTHALNCRRFMLPNRPITVAGRMAASNSAAEHERDPRPRGDVAVTRGVDRHLGENRLPPGLVFDDHAGDAAVDDDRIRDRCIQEHLGTAFGDHLQRGELDASVFEGTTRPPQ